MRKLLLISLLLLFLAGSAQAYVTIVKDYPELPACKDNKECRPGQGGFGLPEYVKYIFIFSLGAVGIIGMLALILAAFSYVMSAGNPQKAADAKDQIVSALLGLLLLIGSWVLLNMINPDLLKLGLKVDLIEKKVEYKKEPPKESTYACWCCKGHSLAKKCDPQGEKGERLFCEAGLTYEKAEKRCRDECDKLYGDDHNKQVAEQACEFKVECICESPEKTISEGCYTFTPVGGKIVSQLCKDKCEPLCAKHGENYKLKCSQTSPNCK